MEKLQNENIDEYNEKLRRLKRKRMLQNKHKKRLINDYYWGFITAFFGIVYSIAANFGIITLLNLVLSSDDGS